MQYAVPHPQSSGSASRRSSWQEKLQGRVSVLLDIELLKLMSSSDHCRDAQIHPPVWNIVSDRRGQDISSFISVRCSSSSGGRTAWSSTVTIGGKNIPARFWYDGPFVENAKEDAAEVALQHLRTGSPSSTPTNSHR